MRKNSYTVDEVLASLSRKNDVKVDRTQKIVYILNGKNKKYPKKDDLGIRTLGKIDFLVNYMGYVRSHVSEFNY